MTKKILPVLFLIALVNSESHAQILERFDDGDFTNNPQWVGNLNSFVVNSSFQLQSNDTVANSTFYLSTASALALSAQWEFWLKLNFNPSSANYIDAWLISSSSELNGLYNRGYFVRIGNTDDEVSLYRKDGNDIITKIIDGANGVLNHSNNTLKIKVVRHENNHWVLYRDPGGTGSSYISEGSAMDTTYATSSFFGFLIKQSSSGFFQKHFIDDIEIKNDTADTTPPSIRSVTSTSATTVEVLFDEPLDKTSAGLFSNYFADKGLGMPISVNVDNHNSSLIHLTFENKFTSGEIYTLTLNDIQDLSGNVINNGTAIFSYYVPQQYDIVIDEIMADPSPQVGLPNTEWIELKNVSSFAINVKGWRLSDLTGTSGPMPDFTLEPDSFVIVCAASAISGLSSFGKAISVTGFPSLDNDGDLISIINENGKTIHAVNYSSDWHQNELKKKGGWSLEMVDPKNPCSGLSNWTSSNNQAGGTPGKPNSVNRDNKDNSPPKLLRAAVTNDTTITVFFNETVDSLKSAGSLSYTFDNGLSALGAIAVAPLFDKAMITLNKSLNIGTIYHVTGKNISDCSGNNMVQNNPIRFGVAQPADSFDIVINEVLFNPLPTGVDYVELYNRSKKIIDLSKTYIANRNSNNIVSSIMQLSESSFLLFPGDYLVITINPDVVKSQFTTTNPDAFLKIKSMPSFPNDRGNVIILNEQGNIIDEVSYSEKWHFALIHNTEGVSLERIDFDGASVQSNFHSASTSSGYGTPGYRNSQFKANEEPEAEITISPKIFSPDNDGIDDFVTINYSFPSAGYVANVTIFDASGRPVRYLQKNSLSGNIGFYRWDGLNDKNQKLPQGIYIIYTEIFNKEGKKKQFKNTVVLARRAG